MTAKEKYRTLCADKNFSNHIPVFSNPSWLDAVASHWDICIVEEQGHVIAALPYCWKGNFLTKRIYLPDLSFYQSPIFFEKINRTRQNKFIGELSRQLPKMVKSYFKFLPEYFELDLSAAGYSKEEYSTHLLKNKKDHVLSSHHKRHIQKGIKNNYMIRESPDLHRSFQLLTATFKRQGITGKIHEADFIKIARASIKNNTGTIWDCIDPEKNILASAFIVQDAHTTYYLMGGYATEYKNSGAMTFLLDHIIQLSIADKKDFNFCGSSKKSIAHYFEGFGATPVPVAIWKKSLL